MPWTVYILECGDKTLYTGVTNDLDRRIQEHERGKGARYTRGRAPFTVMYSESAGSKGEALSREIAIKKLSRTQKLRLATRTRG